MKFVTLTTEAHEFPILVNPDNIVAIEQATGGCSRIFFVGNIHSYVVKETQEEIQNLCEVQRGLGMNSRYSL